ncbi:MAG: amino acid permease [Gemmatimonadetes bacterium]|nr:amino acid permease [Gemmatimonadota bacterium]
MSFADLARRFPESGGVYTYAKKVLNIEVAFLVGWVVWFASIVAGVLYALGFAAFAAEGLARGLAVAGVSAVWAQGPALRVGLTVASIAVYTMVLARRVGGAGDAANVGKVIVFAVLIGAGILAWAGESTTEMLGRLDPFMPGGSLGVVAAMGYTFIALQGFGLIPTVGGEVKDPARNVPLGMYLSLGIALAIYLPLLFLMATVGAPPGGIRTAAIASPESLVAISAERFMGPSGYWLVIGAGVLSMLSALSANVVAASRVAFTMARDRTLPRRFGRVLGSTGTPAVAVAVSGIMMAVIALVVGEVAAAGAASSLIFLVSFAMVHWTAALAARRSGKAGPAVIPIVGGVLCLGLSTFQAFVVPEAGSVIALWLAIGAVLYLTVFASGASTADASAEARDPDLARLRGRSPLVLVPIANPARAASLVDVAATLRTPGTGRVLLLSVVRPRPDKSETEHTISEDAEAVLREALQQSFESSLAPETLFTIASDVWREIARVARVQSCETVLLGLPDLGQPGMEASLEGLLAGLDADAVIVRAPRRWRMDSASRVLVPVGGRREHSHLRARLLSSLSRSEERSLTFLHAVPPTTSTEERRHAEREMKSLARDEAAGPYEVALEVTGHAVEAIIAKAADADLVVMGMERRSRGQRPLGDLALAIAQQTDVPLVLISRRPQRSIVGLSTASFLTTRTDDVR